MICVSAALISNRHVAIGIPNLLLRVGSAPDLIEAGPPARYDDPVFGICTRVWKERV